MTRRLTMVVMISGILVSACAAPVSTTKPSADRVLPPSEAVASPVATSAATPTPTAGASSTSGVRTVNGRLAFAEQSNGTGILHIASIRADGIGYLLLDRSESTKSEGPEWIPGVARLLFDSDRAGNIHVFSMDVRGNDVQQLTSGDGFEGFPSISPDGSMIALDTDGVTLIDADGSNRRQIAPPPATPGFDTNPAFSPDGSKVAFEQVLDTSKDHGRSAIFVVNVDGSGLKQLTRDWTTEPTKATWSQDGSRIFFNDHRESGSKAKNIWVMSADGGDLTRLTSETTGSHSFGPDVSPDGTKVAFVHYQAGEDHHSIEIMNVDGSGATRLWTGSAGHYVEGLTWGSQP